MYAPCLGNCAICTILCPYLCAKDVFSEVIHVYNENRLLHAPHPRGFRGGESHRAGLVPHLLSNSKTKIFRKQKRPSEGPLNDFDLVEGKGLDIFREHSHSVGDIIELITTSHSVAAEELEEASVLLI